MGSLAAVASGAEPPPSGGDPASGAIRFYQQHISSLRHARCPFEPSCSQYALEAIRAHGVLVGSARAADRLMRCNGAARSFYAADAHGRLLDPVDGSPRGRQRPRVPRWLAARPNPTPPPVAIDSTGLGPVDAAWRRASVASDLSFARVLADRGDCERATTEYERAAHVAGDPTLEVWAHVQSGACHYEVGAWDAATAEFLEAARLAETPEESFAASHMAAASQFNAGKYAGCETLLAECVAGMPARAADTTTSWPLSPGNGSALAADAATQSAMLALLGIGAMARGRWEDARDRFEHASEGSAQAFHPAKLGFLIARAAEGEHLPRRNAGLAAALSTVLPGAGQVYSGRVQDGLRHFIFNGALVGTIVKLALDEHYAAAYLVGAIELPFYLGNIRGARASATAFNVSKRMEFVATALEQTETEPAAVAPE